MNLEQVMKHYRIENASPRKLAETLGITSACVYGWINKGFIPMQSQMLIELHSNGKLKRDKQK